jgi:hypothetical protein
MIIVAICGGGGKTTISNKYPNLFLDIDEFVWGQKNKSFHSKIELCLKQQNFDLLGEIYKEILISNKSFFKIQNKIILMHHPENAAWINDKCILNLKPNYELFLKNIENRSEDLKKVSINSWNMLDEAHIFNSYLDLENILLNLAGIYKLNN